MVSIQEAEQTIFAKLLPNELIENYVRGDYSNCSKRSPLQKNALLIATNHRIFHFTHTHLIEYPYKAIEAIYHRNKIMNFRELIFFINGVKHSFSSIEEGCPIHFMTYVHEKMRHFCNNGRANT
ncbi:PH domain-containing protein [Kurthia sibirica]|uniref:YokE-like PH domain-containing protein n=1 Tax=Kurthia sibirica TaxID=202750 RepID=A0A2U3AIR9_9BACL|nr:PH domain-containing protein [Kurthia sibirica]PWI24384.1 hypothetical protein DEX24_13690 [Kurthia sibirica]GEK33801.1 hypothetical protein KSI01_13340 [Kurthia sibirica]